MSSINKYGEDNFTFETIDSANNLNELNDKEIYWINFYNSISPNGYNVTGGGQGKKMKTRITIFHFPIRIFSINNILPIE